MNINVGTVGHVGLRERGKSIVEEFLIKQMLNNWPKPIEVDFVFWDDAENEVVVCESNKRPYYRQNERW